MTLHSICDRLHALASGRDGCLFKPHHRSYWLASNATFRNFAVTSGVRTSSTAPAIEGDACIPSFPFWSMYRSMECMWVLASPAGVGGCACQELAALALVWIVSSEKSALRCLPLSGSLPHCVMTSGIDGQCFLPTPPTLCPGNTLGGLILGAVVKKIPNTPYQWKEAGKDVPYVSYIYRLQLVPTLIPVDPGDRMRCARTTNRG